MPKLTVSIPEPCTQSWFEMTPIEKGRYCNSCQKEVIDFRNWDAAELQNWFANRQGSVCGRLSPKQLDYFKPATKQRSRWDFSAKVMLASALALFTVPKAYGATLQKNNFVIGENKHPKRLKIQEDHNPSDSLITIKGRITAASDKQPLPDVLVHLKNSAVSGITGPDGQFTLQAKAKPNEKLLLTFSCLAYETKELEITPNSNSYELALEMVYNDADMTVGMIIVKRPLFKRVWNFIKSPFVKRH